LVWVKKIEDDIELEDVITAINSVATNKNIKGVGRVTAIKRAGSSKY